MSNTREAQTNIRKNLYKITRGLYHDNDYRKVLILLGNAGVSFPFFNAVTESYSHNLIYCFLREK